LVKVRSLLAVTAASALCLLLATSAWGGAGDLPACQQPTLRTRPDITRRIFISCTDVDSVRIVTPPAHSDISGAWTYGSFGLTVDVTAGAGAPRFDEAVFELTGPGGTVEQHVPVEVIPASENGPPVCHDSRVEQHTDGTERVSLWFEPNCSDPEGDDFVLEGAAGPGEHTQSPKTVMAGPGERYWGYKPATSDGAETTTIWATDSLGARSADAVLTARVGPGVDTPPKCGGWPTNGSGVETIPARQGKTRRFAVLCEDPESDPFTASLSAQPARGAISGWGAEPSPYAFGAPWVLYHATYAPADDSLDPDPFSVTVTGSDGQPHTTRLAIAPRPPDRNGGGSCSADFPAHVTPNEPTRIGIWCADAEGDPLTAEAISAPQHGALSSFATAQTPTGAQVPWTTYTPDRDYVGLDSWNIRVTDGYGLVLDTSMEVRVEPYPGSSMVHDGASPSPPGPPAGEPAAPTVGPIIPKPSSRAVAEHALGTQAIKRLRKRDGVQVWARSKLSRADLERFGRAPGLVVMCSSRCVVRADSRLARGPHGSLGSRRKTVAAVTAGQPNLVWLTLDRSERRALRSTHKSSGRFDLRVRRGGRGAASVRSSIPIARR
jgi:hypothetical protein